MSNKTVTKPYSLGAFLMDCFLTIITGGLWLVYKIFKFFRSNS